MTIDVEGIAAEVLDRAFRELPPHEWEILGEYCLHCMVPKWAVTGGWVIDGCRARWLAHVAGEREARDIERAEGEGMTCRPQPVHHPACSNQNVVHPLGRFAGAAACFCQDWF